MTATRPISLSWEKIPALVRVVDIKSSKIHPLASFLGRRSQVTSLRISEGGFLTTCSTLFRLKLTVTKPDATNATYFSEAVSTAKWAASEVIAERHKALDLI